jgi:transposase
MLGKRSVQYGMFEADHLYLDHVGRNTFYGFLASLRGRLFRDEEFAAFYCPDNGRLSVPPSLLATALLLQTYERVSDEEAKARADFDLRWKVALGIGIEDRPFAKSTLQLFRSHLVLHDQVRAVFQKSLTLARETGYLRGRKLKAVLDTSYIPSASSGQAWAGGPLKTPTTSWPTASSSLSEGWRRDRERNRRPGPRPRGCPVTSGPA